MSREFFNLSRPVLIFSSLHNIFGSRSILPVLLFLTLMYNSINNISFASINCNSLNMSTINKSMQKNKLYGITKLRTDIIFISDIRLSNRNLGSNIEELKGNFLMIPYGAYKFFYNSSMNKRGTCILIKNDIAFLELQREADPEENFLLLRAEIKGKNFTIGSIYGPNSHDRTFFTKLEAAIQVLGCDNVILGSDWNCSYCSDPIADNIDCLNMTNIPNLRHSLYVQDLCQSLNLMDPYRGFFPNRRDYTFISRNTRSNKSVRISTNLEIQKW